MKVLQVNLAGIHRYMDSICLYVKCRRINFCGIRVVTRIIFVPFQIEFWKGTFFFEYISRRIQILGEQES